MTYPDPLEKLLKQMTPPIDDSGVWERIELRARKRRWSSSLRWLPPPGPEERSGVQKEASRTRRTSGLRVAVYASIAVVLVAAVAVGSLEAVKYLGKGTTIVYITDETTVTPATTQAVTPTTESTATTTAGRLGELVWKFQAGATVGSPVVFDGVAYFGSEDNYLYAVDVQSGAEKWKFQTGGPVTSSPVISGGVVYFGSEDNYLYALDVRSGTEQWKFQTGGPVGSPAVSDGVVYFGSWDDYLYAVDIQSGKEQWKFKTGGNVGSPAVSDGVVCLAAWTPTSTPWTSRAAGRSGSSRRAIAAVGTPAISDGVVYFGGVGPASQGRLPLCGRHPERHGEVEVRDGRNLRGEDRVLPGHRRRGSLLHH